MSNLYNWMALGGAMASAVWQWRIFQQHSRLLVRGNIRWLVGLSAVITSIYTIGYLVLVLGLVEEMFVTLNLFRPAAAALFISVATIVHTTYILIQVKETVAQELADLEKMRSEIVQNLSHELRTPLTIILGYLELLVDGVIGELDEEQRQVVVGIFKRGQALHEIVEQSIALRQQPFFETVDIKALVHLHTQRLRPEAEKRHVELGYYDNSGSIWIRGDVRKLGTAVDALLDNALKFTEDGGVISVKISVQQHNIVISIADTGIGILSEQVNRIFDVLYQGDSSTTRRYGGMGLGLAVVKHVAEVHDGRVTVVSELGRGSTFELILPR